MVFLLVYVIQSLNDEVMKKFLERFAA